MKGRLPCGAGEGPATKGRPLAAGRLRGVGELLETKGNLLQVVVVAVVKGGADGDPQKRPMLTPK